MSEENQFPQGQNEDDINESESLGNARPAVAAAPKKIIVVVGIAVLLVGIILKSLFFSSPPAPVVDNKPKKDNVAVSDAKIAPPTGLPTPPSFSNLPTPV
ncbi:MAG: hypothetical protein WCJ33_07770, partial [Pseudomonadota bacterium]